MQSVHGASRRHFASLDRLFSRLTLFLGILCFPLTAASFMLHLLDLQASAALLIVGLVLVFGWSRTQHVL
jgi:hypothetical protein